MSDASLLTAGYARHVSADAFCWYLAQRGSTLLIDVRARPYSKKPGLDKAGLAAAAKRQGIRYVHDPKLGAVDKDWLERLYSDIPGEHFDRYRVWLERTASSHLDRLAAIADQRPTIVCGCHDPGRCHRGVIAELVEQRGTTVTHFLDRPPGRAELPPEVAAAGA